MFSVESLKAGFNTEFIGCEINYQPETNSTNVDAWKHVNDGCVEGTVFITDNQKMGRGRRQNKWFSSPNNSLIYSFILLPNTELEKLGLLPLLTGVSIVNGIQLATSIKTGLKWPNDIMLNRKKMGGILIESRSSSNGLAVVVGVGLNINENDQDINKTFNEEAISLAIYSGGNYRREQILSAILNEFELLYKEPWDRVIPIWKKHCIHKNSKVSFHVEDRKYEGIFQGIASNGYAEIQINGKTQNFPAGVVTL